MLKIISCAGFGNTGSSIVTDFFCEFSSIKVVDGSDFEFSLLHENDGIRDLEYAVTEGHRLKVDLAIKRFIKLVNTLNEHNPSGPNYKDFFNGHFIEYTKEYLNSLGIIEWKNGWWHRIFEVSHNNKYKNAICAQKFNKLMKKKQYGLYETNSWHPSFTGFTDQYYIHLSKAEFKEKTKNYLAKLFSEMANNDEYLLFDQLFPSNVDNEYLEYFDFAKVIVVDRDPRDLYFMNKVFWGSGYVPSENINTFISWFKATRENRCENCNILHINFEDMIYNTDETQRKLCNFVGIDLSKHDKQRTMLFVEKSLTNTQVFKRYNITDEKYNNEINSDINTISSELAKYIYHFPEEKDENIIKKDQIIIIEKKTLCLIIFPKTFL